MTYLLAPAVAARLGVKTSTSPESGSGPSCDNPEQASQAASGDDSGSPGASSSGAANSARTPEGCTSCASLRSQNTALANLLTDEADALHAVREYALECSERAGAQIDAATVSARLWPILAGVNLIPRPCPRCVERRLLEVKHAEFLTGLAGLQRVAG